MAVKFISHVDENKNGEWFIKLTDTLENSSVICDDLNQYKEQIEELGGEYGGDIEVVWTKSKTLSMKNYQDLNEKMAELQKEYQEEINQINQNTQDNSGFNPNE
jgi:tRNA uridine 5-carbamoylmethylation protein Kti12